MILEVDCGNSLIKWRVYDSVAQLVICEGAALGQAGLLLQLNEAGVDALTKCRIASVRSDPETFSLISAINLIYSIPVELARTGLELAGVVNGYSDYKLLGVDRWLAIVGAFALTKSACLVLDLGTAVTADFVDSAGAHLGGFICPGIKMLRDQLDVGTARVAYLPTTGVVGGCPGKNTAEAVERGTELMLRGFVGMQINKARELWGADCRIFVTGGDSGLVRLHFNEVVIIPDLVFRGLALACPD